MKKLTKTELSNIELLKTIGTVTIDKDDKHNRLDAFLSLCEKDIARYYINDDCTITFTLE